MQRVNYLIDYVLCFFVDRTDTSSLLLCRKGRMVDIVFVLLFVMSRIFLMSYRVVEDLQKYVSVNVFGACGTMTCLKDRHEKCMKMVSADYKFYLSFENSLCRDYVTEKFFGVARYLRVDSLQIYIHTLNLILISIFISNNISFVLWNALVESCIAFQGVSLDMYCLPFREICFFIMIRKLTVGFKSWEQAGQIIKMSNLNLIEASNPVVFLAACAGALLCINITLSGSVNGSPSSHEDRSSLIKSQYVTVIIIITSGTLTRTNILLRMMPAQNMTLLSSWRRKRMWAGLSCSTHLLF